MDTRYYRDYDIYLTDIWDYERSLILSDQNDLKAEYLYKLLDQMQIIIPKKTKPFITNKQYKESEDSDIKSYYERHEKELVNSMKSLKAKFYLDFVAQGGDFYPCFCDITIKVPDFDIITYQFFLSLKLRHFKKALIFIPEFLEYQKNESFKNNIDKFYEVMEDCIIQGPDIIPNVVVDKLHKILASDKESSQKPISIDIKVNDKNTERDISISDPLLKVLFVRKHIEHYLEFEKKLIEKGFLNDNLMWNENKPKYLVLTIYSILKDDYKWLKEPTSGHIRSIAKYATFFENRYGLIRLNSYFRNERIEKYSQKIQKAEFFLVDQYFKNLK